MSPRDPDPSVAPLVYAVVLMLLGFGLVLVVPVAGAALILAGAVIAYTEASQLPKDPR